jgi:hypothetical protein
MSRIAARMPVRAHRRSRPGNSTSRWIAAWPGGALLGVLNGTARQMLYARRTGDRTAHQLATATMIALLAAYFVALDRRWPLQTRARALRVGSGWLALTAMFEFGFGTGSRRRNGRSCWPTTTWRTGGCGAWSWRGRRSARWPS